MLRVWLLPRVLTSLWSTLGELILMKTWMGANEVLANWLGWLIVSQSSTTSCMERENSKMRSISAWISAEQTFDIEIGWAKETEGIAGPRVGTFHQGTLGWVVEQGAFGQRDVGRHPGDDDPALFWRLRSSQSPQHNATNLPSKRCLR